VQAGEVNLGVTQTKRQLVIDNTISAGASLNSVLPISDACNVHGLIVDIWVGSQVDTQHDFGKWAVMQLPRGGTGIPAITTANINTENDNAVFWMLGAWMIIGPDHNHIGGAPRTSRNCPKNGRVVVAIENSSVSAGAVRVHGTVTWFETIT